MVGPEGPTKLLNFLAFSNCRLLFCSRVFSPRSVVSRGPFLRDIPLTSELVDGMDDDRLPASNDRIPNAWLHANEQNDCSRWYEV